MNPLSAASTTPSGQGATRAAAGLDMGETILRAGMTEDEKIRMAAEEFEGYLMRIMLKQMRATVMEGGLLPKSSGERMFRDMMDEHLSRDLGSQVGMGLSDAIVRQLSPASTLSVAKAMEASPDESGKNRDGISLKGARTGGKENNGRG